MQYFLAALSGIFTLSGILLCLGGTIFGLVLGAIPGINTATALVMALPLSYALDTTSAYILLISIFVGGISGGYIGSILLGIPGTVGSIATCYDGYALTRKGDPVRALSAAAIANALGTIPSFIIAMLLCKPLAAAAVKLGPWEYFSLCMCAIVLIVTLSKGNFFKGMISAGLGLLFSEVGFAPICGTPRFTFGSYYLMGGFTLICVMMGLFAGRVIILEYARNERGNEQHTKIKLEGFKSPLKDFMVNKINVLRSFFIGLWIGFLPGMGPALSNVVAYAQAKSSSKHPEKFGEGCIDGVIAPEVANNASVGGALIPAIALGIPGDGGTALLLGALVMHGLESGPLLFQKQPILVYAIFICGILSAFMMLLIQIFGMKAFPALLNLPYHWFYPTIVVLCFVGVYISSANIFMMGAYLVLTAIGLWMSYAGVPASPFCLSFVLGQMIEKNFRRAMSFGSGDLSLFLKRPVSGVFIVIAIASIAWPPIREHFFAHKNLSAVSDED